MSVASKYRNDLEQRRMEREAHLMNREIEKEAKTKSRSDYNIRSANNITSPPKRTENKNRNRNQFRAPSSTSEGGMVNLSTISRRPGERPSSDDLTDVVFSKSNKFAPAEIVLVLRSRGGFVYGQVKASKTVKQCYNDSNSLHPYIEYRISYRNSQGKEMYKDLPGAFIGKLPPSPSLISNLGQDNIRRLGERATIKDLNNVTFNPRYSFISGEVVVVARSTGGFSYGEVVSPIKMQCGQSHDTTHKIKAFRVCIDTEKKMRKDLPPGSIGKLPISESISMPALTSIKQSEPHISSNNNNTSFDNELEDEIICWDPKAYGDANNSPTNETPFDLSVKDNDNGSFNFDFDSAFGEETKEEICTNEVAQISEKITSLDITKHNVNPNVISLKNDIPRTSVIKFDKPPTFDSPQTKENRKCLVVLDIPNIAKKHGKHGKFSTKGVKICIDYWKHLGHEVIGFLPEHYVSKKPNPNAQITLADYLEGKVDNLPLLQQFIDEGIIALTPPQDYDDSYCIRYAKDNGGVIVTNDMYRDHIEKQEEKNKVYRWMKEHLISFTFVRDSFIPNPDFVFPSQRTNNRKRG